MVNLGWHLALYYNRLIFLHSLSEWLSVSLFPLDSVVLLCDPGPASDLFPWYCVVNVREPDEAESVRDSGKVLLSSLGCEMFTLFSH